MRKQIHDNPIDRARACSLSHGTWRRVGVKLACAGACVLMVGQLLLAERGARRRVGSASAATQYNRGTADGDDAGTWSWDRRRRLKLNGYDGAGISAQGNLTIGVAGNNTITADAGRVPLLLRTVALPLPATAP